MLFDKLLVGETDRLIVGSHNDARDCFNIRGIKSYYCLRV